MQRTLKEGRLPSLPEMLDLDAHVGVIYSASRFSSSPSNVRLRCQCVEYLTVQHTLKVCTGQTPHSPSNVRLEQECLAVPNITASFPGLRFARKGKKCFIESAIGTIISTDSFKEINFLNKFRVGTKLINILFCKLFYFSHFSHVTGMAECTQDHQSIVLAIALPLLALFCNHLQSKLMLSHYQLYTYSAIPPPSYTICC